MAITTINHRLPIKNPECMKDFPGKIYYRPDIYACSLAGNSEIVVMLDCGYRDSMKQYHDETETMEILIEHDVNALCNRAKHHLLSCTPETCKEKEKRDEEAKQLMKGLEEVYDAAAEKIKNRD